jgi:N-acyl-D-aspartate/D-glutamate deacylase
MLDVLIRGGTIVDGSGQPARKGDIGIRDGRIAAIGTISEAARETIDAKGKVVSPGFVDVHTHYDAQAFWDGPLSLPITASRRSSAATAAFRSRRSRPKPVRT